MEAFRNATIAEMADEKSLLSEVVKLMAGLGKVRHRRMFGGDYIYCDDLFIAVIHDDTLYFKANAKTSADFVAKGLKRFSYLKDGELTFLEYYQAPSEVFVDLAALEFWASKAQFAAKQDAEKRANKKGVPKTGNRQG